MRSETLSAMNSVMAGVPAALSGNRKSVRQSACGKWRIGRMPLLNSSERSVEVSKAREHHFADRFAALQPCVSFGSIAECEPPRIAERPHLPGIHQRRQFAQDFTMTLTAPV